MQLFLLSVPLMKLLQTEILPSFLSFKAQCTAELAVYLCSSHHRQKISCTLKVSRVEMCGKPKFGSDLVIKTKLSKNFTSVQMVFQ